MIIDEDIRIAVQSFNNSPENATLQDMGSRVNKIFNEVTGIFGYIWNILTFGSYFTRRTAMIREALRENFEPAGTDILVQEAIRATCLNAQMKGTSPTRDDANWICAQLHLVGQQRSSVYAGLGLAG